MTESPFVIRNNSPTCGIELYETADTSARPIRVKIEIKDISNPNAGVREKLEHVRYLLDLHIKWMSSADAKKE